MLHAGHLLPPEKGTVGRHAEGAEEAVLACLVTTTYYFGFFLTMG